MAHSYSYPSLQIFVAAIVIDMGPSSNPATDCTSTITDLFFLLSGSNTQSSALLLPTSWSHYLLQASGRGPSGLKL